MSHRARQRRDKRAEIPDEAALSRLMTNGAEAWRDVTDAAAWVDELRGNTMTTDQFQPLRDALAAKPTRGPLVCADNREKGDMSHIATVSWVGEWCIGVDCGSSARAHYEDRAPCEVDARAIVASYNAAPALLAEVDLQQARSAQLLEAEHAMSDAYVRLRMILGAMDPPDRCTAQELWAYVEGKASNLQAEVERLNQRLANTQSDFTALQRALIGDTGASAIMTAHELRKEVERLTAELAAARVDAERYRWLREQHTYDGEGDEPALTRWFVQAGREPVPCDPGMLDAAIDAARTA